MRTTTNHTETFRSIPTHATPLSETKLISLLDQEWSYFKNETKASGEESKKASLVIPLGVPSSFQYWDPYPISIKSAKGAWMTDVDGRQLLDLSMGFGAMLVGHLNPTVVAELKATLEIGTLFVTPSPSARDAAELLCKRFAIDQIRFTNSGTEATMYAVRLARAVTGRNDIVKVEGGYHGSYDPLMVSAKPDLASAGSATEPTPVFPKGAVPGGVFVVPYNNLESLEKIFRENASTIACFVVEPVLENLGIVLPDSGYLEGVRALCDQYDVILIFDEVKTGLTAGPQGAAQRLGV